MADALLHYSDLNFLVVAKDIPEESYHADFVVYDVIGGEGSALLFQKSGGMGGESTESLGNAEVFLHGFVKWDVCSNWHFDVQDKAMIHCCEREHMTRIGEVMARCWDYAAECLETSICKETS